MGLAALGLAALLLRPPGVRGGNECTGGWDCGVPPPSVDLDLCSVTTKRPCTDLTDSDLYSMRHAAGHMDTAVLFE